MTCDHINLPGGARAIVCSSRSAGGRPAPLLCDWKVDGGTCDAPICARCATSPAEGKDLCPAHAEAFRVWKAGR
jgi:hypothetical protein